MLYDRLNDNDRRYLAPFDLFWNIMVFLFFSDWIMSYIKIVHNSSQKNVFSTSKFRKVEPCHNDISLPVDGRKLTWELNANHTNEFYEQLHVMNMMIAVFSDWITPSQCIEHTIKPLVESMSCYLISLCIQCIIAY